MSIRCQPSGPMPHHVETSARPISTEKRDRLSWGLSPKPRVLRWLFAAPLAILAGVLGGTLARQSSATRAFFAENGPIENLQASVLAVVAVLFVIAHLRSSDSRALFSIGAAAATVVAMTREIPRCGSAFFDGGLCMTAGWKTGVALSALALASFAAWLAPIAWRRAIAWRNLAWVWPAVVVAGILMLADLSETLVYMEIEEALELAAYAYLAAFGLWVLFHTRALPGGTLPERRSLRWPED